MHRTLLLPLEPLDDARLVELAQALEPRELLPNLVLLHADRALLRAAVLRDAVLLRGGEREHPHRQRMLGGRASALRRGTAAPRVALDALPDVRFPSLFAAVRAPR